MSASGNWHFLVVWLVLVVQVQASSTPGHHGFVRFGDVPVPGVVVRVTQGDSEFRTVTDLHGAYSFPNLADGTWTFELEMHGFARVRRDVTVSRDVVATTWELEMLSLREMVAENAPIFMPSPIPLSSSDNSHPTTASPVFDAASPPGAALSPDSAQRVDEVLLINGSLNDGRLSEFGNNRRRGLALYTGDVAIAANNSALDARSYSLTGQDTPQPAYSRADVLLSLSGPFGIPFTNPDGPTFTLVYGRGQNRDVGLQTARLPTATERQGNFSGHPNGPIDPSTSLPFPNSVIPEDRVSPQATELLNLYPLPNANATTGYNYQVSTIGASHRDNLQFQTGSTVAGNRISGSIAFQSTRSDNPNLFALVDRLNTKTVNGSLNWSRLLTANFSVFAQYVFGRTVAQTTPHFANRVNVSGNAGINGNSQDPRDWGPPNLNFSSGIAGLFDAPYAFDRTQSSAISYGSTWTRDGHALSFGGGFTREQVNELSQQNARGTFTFSGTASGIDFADFLLGIPTASAIAFGNADKYFRQSLYNAYVTDDWRITPHFSVNFGVRWEYDAPVTERYGRLVNLDIAPDFEVAAPVVASRPQGALTGQQYPSSLVRPDQIYLQPRVGLAWRPLVDSSLVVRAGYGIYRDPGSYRSIAGEMAQQAPLSTSLSVDNSPTTPLTLAEGFPASGVDTPNTFAVDPNFRLGRTQNWQLSIQQDLPSGLQATATYVGVKGTHLPQRSLPNTFPSGAVDSCPQCPVGYIYLSSNGSSSQHAGTIALRRRQHNGLGASVQYTWSKAIDDAGLGSFHIAQDWRDLSGERALSNFDRRHQLQVQTFYTTGMLAGFGGDWDGWIASLLREWTLIADWRVTSGSPMTPILIAPVRGTGVTGSLRPDRTGASLYVGPENVLLNPGAFSVPAPGEWGNAGRNSITGPGQFSLDASIGRTFRTGEGLVMDLRVDVTNVLNHVTFPGLNSAVNSTQFGLPTGANSMRTIRPSLRLRF